MTTNTEPSSTAHHVAIHSGLVTDNQAKSKSAAFRGALLAFTAPVDRQQPKAPQSSDNGARAAAVSAGQASRQQSVSPPKPSAAVSTFVLQSQSSDISPVQQLVKGFEQSSTGDKFLKPDDAHQPSGKSLSESASRAAARIASIGSLPLLRVPSSLPDGGKHDDASSDNLGSEIPLRSPNPTQSPKLGGEGSASESPPPVRNSQTLPTVATLKPGHDVGNQSSMTSLRKHPQQDAASMLAAQLATSNVRPLSPFTVHKPPTSDRRDAGYPNRPVHEDLDRGCGSNEHRQTDRTKFAPNNSLDPSIPQQPRPATHEHYSGEERSGRSVSKHVANNGTPPARSRRRVPSRLDLGYVDKTTGLTAGSLADAIVASSLASSRTPSPTKNIPPLPPPSPRRPAPPRSLLVHRYSSDTDIPRQLATRKGMRDTLRKSRPDEMTDANTRRHHKHLMKHPNKHHEGSRQRWNDMVTESERKRYEGVWAANRGNFFTTSPLPVKDEIMYGTSTAELVLDLVVRDIWCRSRLPSDALAKIWNLVDRHGVHALTRDEFVVGLWLIDQSLKGRKLPPRVSPTLWASVSHAYVPRRF